MITGETVIVVRELSSGVTDRFGKATTNTVYETVENVLVSPGSRADLNGEIRTDGIQIAWTLHFPKTYSLSLAGAKISVRGETAREVVGDPKPYSGNNTPGLWWMPVELGGVDG